MKINVIVKGAVCLCMAAMIAACGGNAKKAEEAAAAAAKAQAEADSLAAVEQAAKEASAMEIIATLPEEPEFVIQTNLGDIKVKLYKDTPKHRENFEKLALSGYYDGLLFHRVIKDFMIQGGDPNSKDPEKVAEYGKGGPGYTIPAEIMPQYKHSKGALAAARRGDAANPMKESSGSQFYLVQNADQCAQLDGEYTVFGQTVDGFDVIDKIAAVQTNEKDLPVEPVKIITIKLAE